MTTFGKRDSIPDVHGELTENVMILTNSLHEHHKHDWSQSIVSCSIYKRLTATDTFHLTHLGGRDTFHVLFSVIFCISVGFDLRRWWINIGTVDERYASFIIARLSRRCSCLANFEDTKGKCLKNKAPQSDRNHGLVWIELTW